jgi:hypothetical protein
VLSVELDKPIPGQEACRGGTNESCVMLCQTRLRGRGCHISIWEEVGGTAALLGAVDNDVEGC